MAKPCQQCQKDNPSTANFCMFCRSPLVENKEIDELDKLHEELHEAKKDLQLYKKLLEEANTQIEQLNTKIAQEENNICIAQDHQKQYLIEKESYEKEINKKNQELSTLKEQLKQVPNKETSSNTCLAWFVLLFCIGLGGFCYGYQEYENLSRNISSLREENSILKEEYSTLKEENSTLKEKISRSKNDYAYPYQ